MKRALIVIVAMGTTMLLSAQQIESQPQQKRDGNISEETSETRLSIGGYGQIDFNQPLGKGTYQNGTLDVHRFVILFAYRFTDRLKLVSEIEIEHIEEVFVEQAFLSYRLADFISLRGGLLLVPMGIVNEYHEPPTFNGVERPNVDKYLVPTTWREIGAGISGSFTAASLRYQIYLINGFNGYDNSARFNGKEGLRGGRQKAAESYISSPNLSFKINYFGLNGLNIGLAGYFGKSQSKLYDGLDKSNQLARSMADSSVIGTSMLGLDLQYRTGGLQITGQVIYNSLSNVLQYNSFTGSDLGSSMLGYYLEAGYDILNGFDLDERKLIPFIRFENYSTQHSVPINTTYNNANERTDITLGLGFWFTDNAVVKSDYQILNNASGAHMGQLNMGLGFMF